MKHEFTLEISSDNNFSVLNRIINVLNRRRIRIKRLMAHENEDDFRKGGAIILVHTTADQIEKTKHQLERLIEVDRVNYFTGSEHYLTLSERIVDID